MNYTIEDLEKAMLLALDPLRTERGGPAATLGSYGGWFEKNRANSGEAAPAMPAVLIEYLGADYATAGAPHFLRSLRFAVLCASADLRSGESRRREAYDLLERTKKLLNHSDLGLAMAPLEIERESGVDTIGTLAVYRGEYLASFIEDAEQY